MNKREFEETTSELEQKLLRANKLYHKCLSKVILKWMDFKEVENVEDHCIDQKRRVDALFTELKEFH
jgi:hypothetical protein